MSECEQIVINNKYAFKMLIANYPIICLQKYNTLFK
jgi:hypothetical protein